MKMSDIVVIDEERKNAIFNEVNKIKEIQLPQVDNEVEYVKNNKTIKKRKEQQNEKEKRKERSRTPMYQDGNEELAGKFDAYNKWHKEDGIQVMKRKRTTYKNE